MSKKKQTKWFLTKEEQQNITFRKTSVSFLNDLIYKDINVYLYQVVCPRLALDPKASIKLSDDASYLEVVDEKKGDKKSV